MQEAMLQEAMKVGVVVPCQDCQIYQSRHHLQYWPGSGQDLAIDLMDGMHGYLLQHWA